MKTCYIDNIHQERQPLINKWVFGDKRSNSVLISDAKSKHLLKLLKYARRAR